MSVSVTLQLFSGWYQIMSGTPQSSFCFLPSDEGAEPHPFTVDMTTMFWGLVGHLAGQEHLAKLLVQVWMLNSSCFSSKTELAQPCSNSWLF